MQCIKMGKKTQMLEPKQSADKQMGQEDITEEVRKYFEPKWKEI